MTLKSLPYITTEGYRNLQAELKALWQKRTEVTQALSAAAAEGDRSENAEYIYRKKQLREVDRRLRYLQKRLPDLRVIDTPPENPDQVFFGAWVSLEDEEGKCNEYRLVCSDEYDPDRGWISMDSPMARAMLKKMLDDEFSVQTPAGLQTYVITGIRYR